MRLIDPTDSLELLTIEGLLPEDAPEGDERFLGCDVGEYHGGRTSADATSIRLIQLKYSTRHPNRRWTAARLAEKPSQGRPVISRLAAMFGAIHSDLGAPAASRVTTMLVSNQPLAVQLQATLDRVQSALSSLPLGVTNAALCRALLPSDAAVVNQLFRSSGVPSRTFTDFLRSLDLDGCGSDGRELVALNLRREVGSVMVGGSRLGVLGLVELVRSRVLPESADNPDVDRDLVLAALGAQGPASLFPYPPKFRMPEQLIPTNQAVLLADAVRQASKPVLAHGGLGIGKTTSLLQLEQNLPDGSVVVAYDSFADGEFLDAGRDRYGYRACVQIANEIAMRCGLMPLVASDGPIEDARLLERLERLVADAATTLKQDALLVIAVDAADNSVHAAHRRGAQCFVDGLWHLRVGEHVRVVMTSRTGRKDDVRTDVASSDLVEHVLAPFDLDASSEMLLSKHPDASLAEGRAFHEASAGVARVQGYALGTADSVTSAIDLAKRGLSEIFDEILDTALSAIATGQRQEKFAALSVMARPANAVTLAAVLETSEDDVRELVDALFPAMHMSHGGIGFADEDFEIHLAERVGSHARAAHTRFADYYLPRRDTDSEAARNLGEHLFGAGRSDELVALARDEGPPQSIPDGFVAMDTYKTRLRLALRSVGALGEAERITETVKLTIAAADAARADVALLETVREAPELAALHAAPEAITNALAAAEADGWRGHLHFHAASLLARTPERRDDAIEQLKMGQAWLRTWSVADDRSGYHLTEIEIAHGALAALLLDDDEQAWHTASGWRPGSFATEILHAFVDMLPGVVEWPRIERLLDEGHASTLIKARALVAFFRVGIKPSAAYVRGVCRRLALHPRLRNGEWLPELCELALALGVSKQLVGQLLDRNVAPVRYVDTWNPASTLLPNIRAEVIRDACLGRSTDAKQMRSRIIDLDEDNSRSDSRERAYYDSCRALLPFLRARVGLALAQRESASLRAAIDASCDAVDELASRLSGESDHRFSEFGQLDRAAVRLAMEVCADAASMGRLDSSDVTPPRLAAALQRLLAAVDAATPEWSPESRIYLASQLRQYSAASDLADRLLNDAAQSLHGMVMPPSDRRDLLIRAARAALPRGQFSASALSADLFDQAVQAASSLDVDLGSRLRSLLELANGDVRLGASPPDPSVASRLLTALDEARGHVDDVDRELPIEKGLAVAARIDPREALARAFRWADEEIVHLDDALRSVVPICHMLDVVSAEEAFALLELRKPNAERLGPVSAVLDSVAPQAERRRLSRQWLPRLVDSVTTDMEFAGSAKAAQRLLDWVTANTLGGESCVEELRSHLASVNDGESDRPSRPSFGDTKRVDVDAVLASASLDGASDDLSKLRSAYCSSDTVSEYLVRAGRASGGDRSAVLEQVLRMHGSDSSAKALEVSRAVRVLLDEWRGSPDVAAWSRRSLPNWTFQNLPELFEYGDLADGSWGQVIYLPDSIDVLHDVVRDGLASALEVLSADQLNALVRVMANHPAMVGSGASVVDWALQRSARAQAAAPPGSPPGSGRLFDSAMAAMLSHEDVRRRWLTVHALVDYWSRLSDVSPVGEALFQLTTDVGFGAVDQFQMRGAMPRPLTARMWLLIACAELARRDPRLLDTSYDDFVRMAHDQATPHAVNRELARLTAMRIGSANAGLTVDGSLWLANRPLMSSVENGDHRDNERDGGDTAFRFGAMDTLPHWFAPLARVFHDVTVADVAKHADHWVSVAWGRTWDGDCKSDPRVLRRRNDYRLYTNDHGALPWIETAESYLELHGLYLAAGAICDKPSQLERSEYDFARDPWTNWLYSHLPSDAGWWSEDRQSVPASRLSQGRWPRDESAGSESHLRRRSFDMSAVARFAVEETSTLDADNDYRVVDAEVSVIRDDLYVHVERASAMVSSTSVSALLAALSCVSSVTLPLVDDEDESPFWSASLSLPGLEMRPWLGRLKREEERLDDKDPRGFGVSRTRRRVMAAGVSGFPATGLGASSGHEFDPRQRLWSSLNYDRPTDRGESSSTSGSFMSVRDSDLARYLDVEELCLLVATTARVSAVNRRSDEPYESKSATRYAVIKSDLTEERIDVSE